jgi:hypothetical protein
MTLFANCQHQNDDSLRRVAHSSRPFGLSGGRSSPNSVIPTGEDHREGDDLRSGGTRCCPVPQLQGLA